MEQSRISRHRSNAIVLSTFIVRTTSVTSSFFSIYHKESWIIYIFPAHFLSFFFSVSGSHLLSFLCNFEFLCHTFCRLLYYPGSNISASFFLYGPNYYIYILYFTIFLSVYIESFIFCFLSYLFVQVDIFCAISCRYALAFHRQTAYYAIL